MTLTFCDHQSEKKKRRKWRKIRGTGKEKYIRYKSKSNYTAKMSLKDIIMIKNCCYLKNTLFVGGRSGGLEPILQWVAVKTLIP